MVISMANPEVQNDGPSIEMTDVVMEVGVPVHVCRLMMMAVLFRSRTPFGREEQQV
jgi:hypothetical protein